MKKLILLLFIPLVSFSQINGQDDSKDYFNSGLELAELGDFSGAISDYTKAIEINPNYAEAYFNRGFSKVNLRNFSGAISDFTKVIEINSNVAEIAISNESDLSLFTTNGQAAILITAKAYINRAISKYELAAKYRDGSYKKGACEDAMKAKALNQRLGPEAFTEMLLLEYKAGEVRKVVCD